MGKKEETMFSIRGRFHNGSAQPLEPVEGREGQPVIITFLEDNLSQTAVNEEAEWASLRQLLEECKIDTGIPDLAHEHDHYLYGKPKKGS